MFDKSQKDLIIELKNKIGPAAKDIIINAYGLEQKGSNYKCINISKHKNGDKNPSMSWDYDLNQFYCFTCGYILDIYNYHTEIECKSFMHIMSEFGLIDPVSKENKKKPERTQYKNQLKESKPIDIIDESQLKELDENQLNYIKTRKIDINNLNSFEIKSYKGKIAFVYKKDNNIVGVKLRHPGKIEKGKRFTAVPGSKDKNFWNQTNFENKDILYITEGEFDCICLVQCGFNNAISIPDGAGQAAKVIDREIDYLKQYKSIIVLSDNDQAGHDMDKFFIDKLGEKVKLIDKSLMDGKDINEEYFKKGAAAIEKLVNSACIKFDGYRDVTAMPYKGLINAGTKFIPTGIESIDDCINELESRRVTLISGRPGEGKTTFIEQIQNNAIDKGYSVARVDGEHHTENILNNTYKKLIAHCSKYYTLERFGRKYIMEPKKHVLEALQKWHYKKLYLYTKSDAKIKTTEELFEKIKYIVNVEKIDLIILDNLMSLLTANSLEKNEKQAEFVQTCHDLAVNYNLHIILVVHPNKTQQKGQTDVDYYQISGSSDIPNKVDTIMNVSREYDEEQKNINIDGHIEILKNRGYGKLLKIDTTYNDESSLLEELKNNEIVRKAIDWERFLPQQQTLPVFNEVPF